MAFSAPKRGKDSHVGIGMFSLCRLVKLKDKINQVFRHTKIDTEQ